MKNFKKPTLKQKKELTKHKYIWKNWLVLNDTAEEMNIINKISGVQRKILKG